MTENIKPGSIEDRAIGAFVGLAIGDALGTTVEFQPRGSFAPVTGMRGGGVFGLNPGEWTDDTSMALALADAVLENPDLTDPAGVMNRWLRWYIYGDYSHNGRCFDIGLQTSGVLRNWETEGHLPAHDTDSAGNGGIMRLAPAVLAHLDDRDAAIDTARRQSDMTHHNASCRGIAGNMAAILFDLTHGNTEPITPPEITARAERDVQSTGYVVHTFEAALWAFAPQDGFTEIVLRAVNLGDDADSVGAVAGQIAGARYGLGAIPADWLAALAWRDDIIDKARSLIRTHHGGASTSRARAI
ncbi:ADP-ribosylglycohydrolase family protein [Acetobacter nitrogenifigens]|uniref:ADP-ribosylglycohydrolase n=1 Tax=Acetobacter nitrogenifigens DSM 23921 = NBRC 105050 TaxID=1120919 RepID=A0A511XDW7_9PROT|nr:ADP-ribosylglycohydrolase family protein [Acetobacter nitrogenifigens]GEN61146.1 ADP-ribosylglycohydrolase [Acetobacter nitrogenifigens DSM 23921 = NBRC 105050]